MNDTLSRAKRINYLTIRFCIIALYFDDYKYLIPLKVKGISKENIIPYLTVLRV